MKTRSLTVVLLGSDDFIICSSRAKRDEWLHVLRIVVARLIEPVPKFHQYAIDVSAEVHRNLPYLSESLLLTFMASITGVRSADGSIMDGGSGVDLL